MRIKIIGDNNCARATRHLLRKAGFAVTEFLPADVVTQAPHFGYVITIDCSSQAPSGAHTHLSPATHPSNPTSEPDYTTPAKAEAAAGRQTSNHEEASPAHGDASSPTFFGGLQVQPAPAHSAQAHIHFDSVDSELENAILRHVTQLAAFPVVVDRPGGVVHSERELKIIVPTTGDAKTDEAAAVAVEFGVLRGFLDLTFSVSLSKSAAVPNDSRSKNVKKWWSFGVLLAVSVVMTHTVNLPAAPRHVSIISRHAPPASVQASNRVYAAAKSMPVPAARSGVAREADRATLLPAAALAAQGQFVTGQAPVKITDGTNNLVVDPCKAQTKFYVSINQTANAQLVAGTASKKIYICSIHVVVAVATNAALVEGTGSVCATGTAGVSGFGGATAATGWNFAANGGIALGNGDAAVGAEGANADNLCLFNSGTGQVSGGISYVVQ